MSPHIAALIQSARNAAPTYEVVATYADGSKRVHQARNRPAAEMWARGEMRKIGRELIDRETGRSVVVVRVDIQSLS